MSATTTIPTTPCAIQSFDPESAADWSHFRSVPWCASVLSRPGVRPYRSALPGGGSPDCGGDPLLGGFMARGGGGGGGILRHASALAGPGVLPDLDAQQAGGGGGGGNPFPQHLDLYTLGPGLAGIPHTLHGGVLCMLVDAACGRVGFMHRGTDGEHRGAYTAYTNTQFLRPGIMGGPGGTLTVMIRTQVSARLSSTTAAPALAGTEEVLIEDGKGKGKMIVLSSVEGEGGKPFVTGESGVVVRAWKKKGEGKEKERERL